MQNTRLYLMLGLSTLLLAIPFVAMQFTNEVNWSGFDFLVAGALLYGTAFFIEFILQKVHGKSRRLWAVALVLIALLLLWAELAVGIFK